MVKISPDSSDVKYNISRDYSARAFAFSDSFEYICVIVRKQQPIGENVNPHNPLRAICYSNRLIPATLQQVSGF